MKPKEKTFQPTANPEMAFWMRELRKSSASGTHKDRRTRRARTRLANKNKAIQEELK